MNQQQIADSGFARFDWFLTQIKLHLLKNKLYLRKNKISAFLEITSHDAELSF